MAPQSTPTKDIRYRASMELKLAIEAFDPEAIREVLDNKDAHGKHLADPHHPEVFSEGNALAHLLSPKLLHPGDPFYQEKRRDIYKHKASLSLKRACFEILVAAKTTKGKRWLTLTTKAKCLSRQTVLLALLRDPSLGSLADRKIFIKQLCNLYDGDGRFSLDLEKEKEIEIACSHGTSRFMETILAFNDPDFLVLFLEIRKPNGEYLLDINATTYKSRYEGGKYTGQKFKTILDVVQTEHYSHPDTYEKLEYDPKLEAIILRWGGLLHKRLQFVGRFHSTPPPDKKSAQRNPAASAEGAFVNNPQNMHDAEVGQTAEKSLQGLSQSYDKTKDVHSEIEDFIQTFDYSTLQKEAENDRKKSAALYAFSHSRKKFKFLHYGEGENIFTVDEILSLVWQGVCDSSRDKVPRELHGLFDTDSNKLMALRKASFIEKLITVHDMYRSDGVEADLCWGGFAPVMVSVLQHAHTDVTFLMEEGAEAATASEVVPNTLRKLLSVKNQREQRAILASWWSEDEKSAAGIFKEQAKASVREELRRLFKDEKSDEVEMYVGMVEESERPSILLPRLNKIADELESIEVDIHPKLEKTFHGPLTLRKQTIEALHKIVKDVHLDCEKRTFSEKYHLLSSLMRTFKKLDPFAVGVCRLQERLEETDTSKRAKLIRFLYLGCYVYPAPQDIEKWILSNMKIEEEHADQFKHLKALDKLCSQVQSLEISAGEEDTPRARCIQALKAWVEEHGYPGDVKGLDAAREAVEAKLAAFKALDGVCSEVKSLEISAGEEDTPRARCIQALKAWVLAHGYPGDVKGLDAAREAVEAKLAAFKALDRVCSEIKSLEVSTGEEDTSKARCIESLKAWVLAHGYPGDIEGLDAACKSMKVKLAAFKALDTVCAEIKSLEVSAGEEDTSKARCIESLKAWVLAHGYPDDPEGLDAACKSMKVKLAAFKALDRVCSEIKSLEVSTGEEDTSKARCIKSLKAWVLAHGYPGDIESLDAACEVAQAKLAVFKGPVKEIGQMREKQNTADNPINYWLLTSFFDEKNKESVTDVSQCQSPQVCSDQPPLKDEERRHKMKDMVDSWHTIHSTRRDCLEALLEGAFPENFQVQSVDDCQKRVDAFKSLDSMTQAIQGTLDCYLEKAHTRNPKRDRTIENIRTMIGSLYAHLPVMERPEQMRSLVKTLLQTHLKAVQYDHRHYGSLWFLGKYQPMSRLEKALSEQIGRWSNIPALPKPGPAK